MYTLILLVSLIMLFLNHPLSFAFSLFIQTILICIALSGISNWIPLILFLIFLGGILVMFMYVASLSSNEKFKLDMSSLLSLMLMYLVVLIVTMNKKEMNLGSPFSFSSEFQMKSILNPSSSMLYIILTIYLFIALLLIVEFLNYNKKPLRSII